MLALILEKEGYEDEALELLLEILEEEPMYLGVRVKVVELAQRLDKLDLVAQHSAFLACFATGVEEEQEVELVEVAETSGEAEEDEDLLVLDEEDFVSIDMVRSYMQQCLFEEAYECLQKLMEREQSEEVLQLKERLERYLSLLEPEEPA